MKEYSHEVIINRPIDEVITLFTKPEHFTKWQPNLSEYEVYEGDPCCTESKARIRMEFKRGDDLKMVETVVENNLPENYEVRYNSEGINIKQFNHFEEAGGGKTLYRVSQQYNTDGLMKLVKLFKPNYFEKQSERFVKAFKDYAERQS